MLQNVTEGPVHVAQGSPSKKPRYAPRKLLESVRTRRQDLRDAAPSSASGSQQQRVAIAQALAMEPAQVC